jgi:tRNA A37 threonylcarbamoyladenosine dehydratase
MKMHPFHRTELLVGIDGFQRLKAARVAVIGLGGVGSFAAEALVRSGVGHLTLVDFDRVCITNLNRQLHATRKTVGQRKAELMKERCLQINPKADVVAIPRFYCAEEAEAMLSPGFDYVLDCIDNMTAKVHLLGECERRGLPVVSAMGAGGRLDPTKLRITPLEDVRNDPFARLLRRLLREQNVDLDIPSVWTEEAPNDLDPVVEAGFRCICPDKDDNQVNTCESRFQIQGSASFVPPVFGMTMGAVVVNALIGRDIVVRTAKTVSKRELKRRAARARAEAASV